MFADFDKEKECKDLFKEGCKKFRYKLEKVNKVVYDIYIQIDDIKVTYDLTDEEINRFSALNRNLENINEDFKKKVNELFASQKQGEQTVLPAKEKFSLTKWKSRHRRRASKAREEEHTK